MTYCIIVPARLESARLPGKLLLRETGQPLLWHTLDALPRADIFVATDSQQIADAASECGGVRTIWTTRCNNGGERVAEAALTLKYDVIVNVQGDEPELPIDAVPRLLSLLHDESRVMATLTTPLSEEDLSKPSVVKVVVDLMGRALYFSRAPLPAAKRHVGIYAYRSDFLSKMYTLPRTPGEVAESLEQLRVLQNGYDIWTAEIDHPCRGIDTPQDYAEFVTRWRSRCA